MEIVELTPCGMVSRSCMRLVREAFRPMHGVVVHDVRLGHVKLEHDPELVPLAALLVALDRAGFPAKADKDTQLVEGIKSACIELIHFAGNVSSLIRNSDYLSDKLGQPYDRLSKVFSQRTGITLERYIILLKVEKVKLLIEGGEHSLSEVAWMLGYSSVQYLSTQFKQITGVTIGTFKEEPAKYRVPLEKLVNG